MHTLSYHNTLWLLITIFVISVLAATIAYPRFFNAGSDVLNKAFFIDIGKITLPFRLGLDLQGGTHLVYQADTSQVKGVSERDALASVRNVIERRINLFGVAEPLVQIAKSGTNWRLIVELAGIKNVNQAIELIGGTPFLDFREAGADPQDIKSYTPTALNGSLLSRASVQFGELNKPQVSLEFNSQGAILFKELTEKNLGKPLAIFLDGLPISIPTVQSVIPNGTAVITGNFSLQEARELAQRMNAGALPVPITLIAQETVGASLGQSSLSQMMHAALWGIAALLVFIVGYYRFPGLLGFVALMMYVALILALYKLIPVTLTLAGIAGFILSLGIAIDANILIFERIKDERRAGKSLESAIESGFLRAWSSVRDSNITDLITAGALYFLVGSSFVQGFALTLIIGILLSLVTAVFVSRLLLKVVAATRLGKVPWIWKTGIER